MHPVSMFSVSVHKNLIKSDCRVPCSKKLLPGQLLVTSVLQKPGGTSRLPHFTSQQQLRKTPFFLKNMRLLSHQMHFFLTCWQLLFLPVTSFQPLLIHSLLCQEWSLEMQQGAIWDTAPALPESFSPSLTSHDLSLPAIKMAMYITFPQLGNDADVFYSNAFKFILSFFEKVCPSQPIPKIASMPLPQKLALNSCLSRYILFLHGNHCNHCNL